MATRLLPISKRQSIKLQLDGVTAEEIYKQEPVTSITVVLVLIF
jgi:hypothetical protein